jgi:hypothetical protein
MFGCLSEAGPTVHRPARIASAVTHRSGCRLWIGYTHAPGVVDVDEGKFYTYESGRRATRGIQLGQRMTTNGEEQLR